MTSQETPTGVDEAFTSINPNFTGFLIWRVENFKLVAVPPEQYGHFYEGDSYVLYVASEPGKSGNPTAKPKKISGSRLEQYIHFWLGKDTSQDEAGVAAYKSVELDNYLGGAPIQHREVQGNESNRFKSYFKNGIRYLTGGIASGLNHITKKSEPKLYKVKGKRSPSVTQMPSIDWKYFNSGDVFILDTDDEVIFIWIGRAANPMEKLQATKVAQELKVENKAKALVFVEEGEELDLPEAEKILLEAYLDLHASEGVKGNVNDSDEVDEHNHYSHITLYQCSDEDGTYNVTEVKTGPLYQSDLKSKVLIDSFIIDQGGRAMWVWVGKGASKKERTESMKNAHDFVKNNKYDQNIPVTRVVEHGEPAEFKSLFSNWRDPDEVVRSTNQYSIGRIAKVAPKDVDMSSVHTSPQLAASTRLVDNGKGTKTVWRIKNVELEPIDESMYGVFFGGDCYLVHYKYELGDILYYWLGSHRSVKEQTALAIQTVEKDNKDISGNAVQVRIIQGKESQHFLTIFNGSAIIFKGEYQDVLPDTFLLHISGNNEFNTKATEVNMSASCLNSNDVFILKKEKVYFIWCGKGSTGDERDVAKQIAKIILKDDYIVLCSKGPPGGKPNRIAKNYDYSVVCEGQEKDDFWSAIGGKEEYASSEKLANADEQLPARLFQISNATGRFTVEEIGNFSQQDLVPEDIMLLDARDIIFLWLGGKANREEIKESTNLAIQYLQTDPSNRDLDTPIMSIKQGYEPATFRGWFGPWDPDLWKGHKTYEELRDLIELDNPVLQVEVKTSTEDFTTCPKYSYDTLKVKDIEALPVGVDATHKEVYLSAEEFMNIFKMDYDSFKALPKWRQDKLKKSVDLF
uniref:Advillin n=1 Tax=Cacopsylla melanoneura TaxID=428564 RepID=A0A8D9B6V5_9HEMI